MITSLGSLRFQGIKEDLSKLTVNRMINATMLLAVYRPIDPVLRHTDDQLTAPAQTLSLRLLSVSAFVDMLHLLKCHISRNELQKFWLELAEMVYCLFCGSNHID